MNVAESSGYNFSSALFGVIENPASKTANKLNLPVFGTFRALMTAWHTLRSLTAPAYNLILSIMIINVKRIIKK
jgi:hypothetical protein